MSHEATSLEESKPDADASDTKSADESAKNPEDQKGEAKPKPAAAPADDSQGESAKAVPSADDAPPATDADAPPPKEDAETEAAKKGVEKPQVVAQPRPPMSKSEAMRLLTGKQIDHAERIIMLEAPAGPLWKGVVLAMRKNPKDWAEKSHKGFQDRVLKALRAGGFLDAESRSGKLEDVHVALIEHCARKWEASQPKF